MALVQIPTPVASGSNFVTLNGTGTNLSGATTTVSFSGIYNQIFVRVNFAQPNTASRIVEIRPNGSTSDFQMFRTQISYPSTYAVSNLSNGGGNPIMIGGTSTNTASSVRGGVLITGCKSTGAKVFQGWGNAEADSGNNHSFQASAGIWNNSDVVTSITIGLNGSGNFVGGTVHIFGAE